MKKQEKFIFDVCNYLLSIGAKPNDNYIKGKKLIIPQIDYENFEFSINTKYGILNIRMHKSDITDKKYNSIFSVFARFEDLEKCKHLTGINPKWNHHYNNPLFGLQDFANKLNYIL